MTIFTKTNETRVVKILEILAHLKKSIASNKASQDDIWKLLQPAIDEMSSLLGAQTEAPAPSESAETGSESVRAAQQAQEKAHRAPDYIQIREAAQTAPLNELHAAVLIYISRVEEELECGS